MSPCPASKLISRDRPCSDSPRQRGQGIFSPVAYTSHASQDNASLFKAALTQQQVAEIEIRQSVTRIDSQRYSVTQFRFLFLLSASLQHPRFDQAAGESGISSTACR